MNKFKIRRLSMELGAFSVSLSVKDLEASKTFYEKLGFEVFAGEAEYLNLQSRLGSRRQNAWLFYGRTRSSEGTQKERCQIWRRSRWGVNRAGEFHHQRSGWKSNFDRSARVSARFMSASETVQASSHLPTAHGSEGELARAEVAPPRFQNLGPILRKNNNKFLCTSKWDYLVS